MANLSLGGFRPWGTFTGGEGVFPRPMRSEVASGYATGIFRGDIIIPVSDGTVAVAAASDNGKLMGVVLGVSVIRADGKRYFQNTVPASTAFTPSTVGSINASYVDWLPLTGDLIMEVDADDGVTVTTIAGGIGLIGENADLVTGTGDTVTGVSGMLLDISTHATSTFNFRIVGISHYPTVDVGIPSNVNDLTLTRAKYLVVCNEGFLPPFTTTGL